MAASDPTTARRERSDDAGGAHVFSYATCSLRSVVRPGHRHARTERRIRGFVPIARPILFSLPCELVAQLTAFRVAPCISRHTMRPRNRGDLPTGRSEEHTSELQYLRHLVCS